MTAIDMKTRQVAWQVPLGTVEDTGPLGIKMGLKAPIGMPTIGGPMATQGGLVFLLQLKIITCVLLIHLQVKSCGSHVCQ